MSSPTKRIQVRAQPRAKRIAVQWEGEILKVYLNTPPVDGKANGALIEILAEFFHLPRSRFRIVRGESSRDKCIEIQDFHLISPDKLP